MAVYAIGDVQGCDNELACLLDKLNLQTGDEVWFVGDLVNRGPDSLGVLRRVRALGKAAVCVLGNHDLHLLALGLAGRARGKLDHLAEVLRARDAEELLHWLRHQPLALYRPEMNTLLVHAGVAPDWNPLQTIKLAREVEKTLQGDLAEEFLANMYGDEPALWSSDLKGHDRLRCIVNYLTRSRLVARDGRLDFGQKGPLKDAPDDLQAWFDVPGRASADVRIVFGHWSALGLVQRHNLLGLDTGCVWGRELTAARLDGPAQIVEVPATQ